MLPMLSIWDGSFDAISTLSSAEPPDRFFGMAQPASSLQQLIPLPRGDWRLCQIFPAPRLSVLREEREIINEGVADDTRSRNDELGVNESRYVVNRALWSASPRGSW